MATPPPNPKAPTSIDAVIDPMVPPHIHEAFAKVHRDHPELEVQADRHFAEKHVTLEAYSHARRVQLGGEVLAKTRVYLDQKYWIYCRDAMLGVPQKPIHLEIWQLLLKLVETDRVVCPVSYPILSETFKQHDAVRRTHTARCIDALCRGVAIQPFSTLIEAELYHFQQSHTFPKRKLYPQKQMVWNYAGWVLGEHIPRSTFFDAATSNAIAKWLFDVIAVTPFAVLVESLANAPFDDANDEREWSNQVNEGARNHQHEVTSYRAVFNSEVAGALDAADFIFQRVERWMYENETGSAAPPLGSPDVCEVARLGRNFIYHVMTEGKASTELPWIHIGAGIHAATRYRKQRYRHGDNWDLKHAHSALGYCNAFFTESNLGNLLCQRPLCYDKLYDCRVLWEEEGIVQYLRGLG